MKTKRISVLISVVISVAFLWFVLSTPNAFNMLPFIIYDMLDRGGEYENIFIATFDVVVSIIMMAIVYKLSNAIIPLVRKQDYLRNE
jgi:hypothetical protein